MSESKKVLFILTGSIAAYKACHAVSRLVQAGHEVQCVVTAAALRFVGETTLEGLTGKKVAKDLWAADSIMDHIHLVRWADVIVVAPATANYINSIAHGIANDLAANLFLAHDFKKPWILAPAMNSFMFQNPTTQKSMEILKSAGVSILDTANGVLACGEQGTGKLIEPQVLFEEIQKALKLDLKPVQNSKAAKSYKVLISSGGTSEAIDQVRSITNKSTGATGAFLADALTELGCEVELLRAENSVAPKLNCKQDSFVNFADIEKLIHTKVSSEHFDLVIHAAAVSDYSLSHTTDAGKISSENETLNIQLKRNPKIINQIKGWSRNKNLKLVAFKMTVTSDENKKQDAVKKLFDNSKADLVVHNDLSEVNWKNGTHTYHIYNSTMQSEQVENKQQLVAQLFGSLLEKELL